MFSLTPSYFPNPTIFKGEDVQSRLQQLHDTLDLDIFNESSDYGYSARLEATRAHPPTAAGTLQWNATVFALRTMLAQRDWRIVDNRNCPLIVSPDNKLMIAVMTGDADTGREFGDPKNQGVKGIVLDDAIQKNHDLFESRAEADGSGTQLWVLLYHVVGSEVRKELSIPLSFNNGKITEWSERILLSPTELLPQPDVTPLPGDGLDFEVTRKAI